MNTVISSRLLVKIPIPSTSHVVLQFSSRKACIISAADTRPVSILLPEQFPWVLQVRVRELSPNMLKDMAHLRTNIFSLSSLSFNADEALFGLTSSCKK